MARKFLYVIAVLIVLVIAGLLALRLWSDKLTTLAFVPRTEFVSPSPLATDAFAGDAMWVSRPDLRNDPSRWVPEGLVEDADRLGAAVFFVHPTSYFETSRWNAPLDDKETDATTRRYVKQIASPFNRGGDVYAPRYRQATFGAFLTDSSDARSALDIAYGDVAQAFDAFLESIDSDRPIILAGHSQGSFHLRRLLAERIAGTPLARRIVAAYLIGWPISLARDVPELGLPACTQAQQTGCVISWQSFAEPADTTLIVQSANRLGWLDGSHADGRPFLCSNPLAGMKTAAAPASANAGALRIDSASAEATLLDSGVPGRCNTDGFLLIGDPPDMGSFVLPGNNYHVYDIPLFWRNVRSDVETRTRAWKPAR